jgi:hypothetical protein
MADAVEVTGDSWCVRLRLRVKPGGRRNRLVGAHGGALKLEVSAPPERGKANDAVIALMAKTLGLRRDALRIASGDTSQDKSLEVAGVGPSEVARILNVAGIAADVVLEHPPRHSG